MPTADVPEHIGGKSNQGRQLDKGHCDETTLEKDRQRGAAKTFLWFAEEVGELARAIARHDDPDNLRAEFADVLAWLVTLANVEGVDLEDALCKFTAGCPGCGKLVCECSSKLT